MYYAYKYRLKPSDAHREELDRHRDICRQLYNHALYRFDQIPEDAGTLNQRVRSIRDEIPSLKEWWDSLSDVYSTALQTAVMRIEQNVKGLSALKENGYGVGQLTWKPPREFRSFTYSQSGFELDKKGGQTVLSLSKLADIPIRLHRAIPDDATLKQVTVKKEPTGEWFATFGVETPDAPPEKPEKPEKCVGIDVGILTYAHDTDGTAVGSLDLSDERERLEREQRKLSRKEHGSANYETQRRRVAECHADLRRKRRDFLHKLSNYYAREYDLVAVEEYKCEREGTHFVTVNPRGTTKECASCGVSTEKPLWVREHSCPACGFEADRDANAAWNIPSRGLEDVGVGYSESTPVETALPVDTPVSAKRIVEAGSPIPSRSERRQP